MSNCTSPFPHLTPLAFCLEWWKRKWVYFYVRCSHSLAATLFFPILSPCSWTRSVNFVLNFFLCVGFSREKRIAPYLTFPCPILSLLLYYKRSAGVFSVFKKRRLFLLSFSQAATIPSLPLFLLPLSHATINVEIFFSCSDLLFCCSI